MLSFENSLNFLRGEQPAATLRNFWEPEDGFIWSTGRWCDVAFAFDVGPRLPTGSADLILDLDVFKVEDKKPGQNLMVYLNGLRIGSAYCTKRVTTIFSFETKILTKAENILTIDTPDSAAPLDFDMADARLLGTQLFSLQIRKSG